VDLLRLPVERETGVSDAEALMRLLRDAMPPWPDTLTGVTGGAIGEACVILILVGGLILMWRGFVRPSMIIAALASAALLAAVLPVRMLAENGTLTTYWLPGAALHEGSPIGLVYVCYHLTAGELLLVLLLLAPDPTSSPLTTRGHALFGALLGASTLLLRVLAGIPAAGYWALLIANTCVPAINRATRRRVLGTAMRP
jgi:electron transport complex protein RnfD